MLKKIRITEIKAEWTEWKASNKEAEKDMRLPWFEARLEGDPATNLKWYRLNVYLINLNPQPYKELDRETIENIPKRMFALGNSPSIEAVPIKILSPDAKPQEVQVTSFHTALTQAITNYPLRMDEFTALQDYFYPRGEPARDSINPDAVNYFGELLKQILEGVGYKVEIRIEIKPEFWLEPTADRVMQPIFSSDKRESFLTKLMAINRQVDDRQNPLIYDEPGYNVVGLKVSVEIPNQRAIEGQTQLSLDFDFKQQNGFKLIPIKEMDKPETKEKIDRLMQKIEKDIAKELDTLTLQIKDALIYLAQKKGSYSYYYSEGELLDLLYKRQPKGEGKAYHDTRSKNRVRQRLSKLAELKFSYAIKIGNRRIGIEDAPYIILNPDGKPFVETETKHGKRKKRYNFQSLAFPKAYQALFSPGHLAQYDMRALQFKQWDKYLLFKHIATLWRVNWQKHHGRVEWNLRDILTEAGITIPSKKNQPRFIKTLTQYLDELKKDGFIAGYKRLHKSENPLDDKWRFEAPDKIKHEYKEIGTKYQEVKEVKALKAKKKRLKLEKEVIDLEAEAQKRKPKNS